MHVVRHSAPSQGPGIRDVSHPKASLISKLPHVCPCAVSGSFSLTSVSNQHIPEQYPSNVRNCAASFVQYPSVPKLKVCRAAMPTYSSSCPLRVSNAMRKALGIQASPKSHLCLQFCAPWEPIAHLGTRATSCLPDFRPVCSQRTRLSLACHLLYLAFLSLPLAHSRFITTMQCALSHGQPCT